MNQARHSRALFFGGFMKHTLLKGIDPRDNKPSFWIKRESNSGDIDIAFLSGNSFLSEKHLITAVKAWCTRYLYQPAFTLPFSIDDFEVIAEW